MPPICNGSINVLYYDQCIRLHRHWFGQFPFTCRFCSEQLNRQHYFGIDVRLHSQTVFDLRNRPSSPRTVTTTPPSNIHIDLSVAEPVKNREMSELDESYALMPKINRRMPPARTASEIALFIYILSFLFSILSFSKKLCTSSSINDVN
jgi:hypothetical protein